MDSGLDDETIEVLRKHSKTGRPLGDAPFVEKLEQHAGRTLRPLKQGRKRKDDK